MVLYMILEICKGGHPNIFCKNGYVKPSPPPKLIHKVTARKFSCFFR